MPVCCLWSWISKPLFSAGFHFTSQKVCIDHFFPNPCVVSSLQNSAYVPLDVLSLHAGGICFRKIGDVLFYFVIHQNAHVAPAQQERSSGAWPFHQAPCLTLYLSWLVHRRIIWIVLYFFLLLKVLKFLRFFCSWNVTLNLYKCIWKLDWWCEAV
jgi:hypothetical protein